MATILVVDDEPRMQKAVSIHLEDAGYEVLTASSGQEALQHLEHSSVDLMISDIRMPGMSGVELLAEVMRRSPAVPVIMLTAFGSMDGVIEAMRSGAVDYVTKPFEGIDLTMRIAKALEHRQLALENSALRSEVQERGGFGEMIGRSTVMQRLYTMVERVAAADSTVLILGESGTGKELLARSLHARSPRAERAFVSVNCIAIPQHLLESEMFGYVRGAFTGADRNKPGKFEAADNGTLFLDEIGDMSLDLQGKILRVLQEHTIEPVGSVQSKKVNVRILTATNKDLATMIRAGEFREDLYHRLNVVPMVIPPLRERQEDIPQLVEFFLRRTAQRLPEGFSVTPDIMQVLMTYQWPGNIRELENLVERAVVLADPEVLRMPGGKLQPAAAPAPRSAGWQFEPGVSYKDAKQRVLEHFEVEFFSRTLEENDFNVSRTADVLGMHRKNLQEKLDRLGINRPRI